MSTDTPTPMERLEALDDAYDLKEVYASDDIAVQMDWLVADTKWALAEIAHLQAEVVRKDAALDRCEIQFRDYARQHRAKGTPEADAKAVVNDLMAADCAAASARGEGSGR